MLRNVDDSMSVKLIGPIDVVPGRAVWTLSSPGVIRLQDGGELLELHAEQIAVGIRAGALKRTTQDLALPIHLKHVHLLSSNERAEKLLENHMWNIHGWTLNILPIARELQGGTDNLLSSSSFRSGKITLFRDAGEFAVNVSTLVGAQRLDCPTPSMEKSSPATARLLTGYHVTEVAVEQLTVPRCMRVTNLREQQLPMPLAAGDR